MRQLNFIHHDKKILNKKTPFEILEYLFLITEKAREKGEIKNYEEEEFFFKIAGDVMGILEQ